jgi:hypothetical protein
VENASLCAVHDMIAAILVNEQLVFVRSADGTQLTYLPDYAECPEAIGGGLLLARSFGSNVGAELITLGEL